MAEFEEILAEINDIVAEDRAALVSLAAKYPDLDKAVLRQKEFKRQSDAFNRDKSKLEETKTALESQLAGWNRWRDENWQTDPTDPTKGWTKSEQAARAELAAVNEKLKTLGAQPGTGNNNMPMDETALAELKTFLATEGYVKKDSLATEFAPKGAFEGFTQRVDQTLGGFNAIYRETAHLPLKFQREFGDLNEDFKIGPFVDFVTANPDRVKDIDKAYEEYVAPKRQQLEFKKQEAKLAADKAAFEAEKAALAARQAAAPNPTDGGSGEPEAIGHFQARLSKPPERPEDKIVAPLGSGISAQMAAEALRKGELVKPAPGSELVQ
jgi:hypothetical protein